MRQLTEVALNITTQCYTDPLERGDLPCGTNVRPIISTRGFVFGIKADGRNADDAFSSYKSRIPYRIRPELQWGPGSGTEKSRDPYDFLLGPDSVVKEIGARWDELVSATEYEKAMQIADEIITSMRGGKYRGIPYSDVSLLQASVREGLTQEELQLFLKTNWNIAENAVTRSSLENLGQLWVRFYALLASPISGIKAMVTPVEMRNGIPRRIGMKAIIEEMLSRIEAAGVRIFYDSKVTSLRRVKPGSKVLVIGFADGTKIKAPKVIANIGKRDLIALGLESEPVKSSDTNFRRAVERQFVFGLSKTYCFWEDAWWATKLKLTIGRTRTGEGTMFSTRYHDGHIVCQNSTTLTGCRGGLLVSYVAGDNTGVGTAIHVNNHNAMHYTPLTNTDNIRRLIPGQMSPIEEMYVEDLVKQLRRVHKSSFRAIGMDPDVAIPMPAGCIFGDWRDVGVHVQMGTGQGETNVFELYGKPVADLDIFLANEAWGQEAGYAQSALESAERALYHHFGLSESSWMDGPWHSSVIKRYNRGL